MYIYYALYIPQNDIQLDFENKHVVYAKFTVATRTCGRHICELMYRINSTPQIRYTWYIRPNIARWSVQEKTCPQNAAQTHLIYTPTYKQLYKYIYIYIYKEGRIQFHPFWDAIPRKDERMEMWARPKPGMLEEDLVNGHCQHPPYDLRVQSPL